MALIIYDNLSFLWTWNKNHDSSIDYETLPILSYFSAKTSLVNKGEKLSKYFN